MDETARPATADDIDELVRLSREGRDAIADARGGAMWLARQAPSEPLEAAYRAAIEGNLTRIVVGCIDDVPLGLLFARVDTELEPQIAVVEELYVTPEARGVSLGEIMMNATIEWASALGCTGIDGYALPGDRATKNFFETFGLVARGIVVHRSFG